VALVVAGGIVVGLAVFRSDDDGSGSRPTAAASTTTTSQAGSAEPTAGGRGVGDPYFPDLGNEGYDVDHYDLDLTWEADRAHLVGVATITAKATHGLSRFDLDLVGLEVGSVTVDDVAATSSRDGRELIVTPARPVQMGDTFVTVVRYEGRPTTVREGTDLFDAGWQIDGRETFVVGEPSGAATYFPGNDHPSDKASYTIRVTAPADQVVAASGRLTGKREAGGAAGSGQVTWTYDETAPMATYLVQVAIGDFELVDGGMVDGVAIRHAFHRDLVGVATHATRRTGEMLHFLSGVLGPYPFPVYGVLAVDEPLGFALETQTLILVGSDVVGADQELLYLHEMAHQWVGDSVSLESWKDIWLNEGFATYAEWLWTEAQGGPSPAEEARAYDSPSLAVPPGDPGAKELFSDTVYIRGAMTLQALREEIGDGSFFRVLRAWTADHAGASVTTADFIALAERESGQQLDDLFRAWLDTAAVPRL
jgi:aminopeptidase N